MVSGLAATGLATVVGAKWYGSDAIELTYKLADGSVRAEILYRDREPSLEIAEAGPALELRRRRRLFRLVAEAKRIDLAYLFDPFLAVTTASVEALPHQITAVYEQMLPRQPLRYLLADDPGAGKTIMTGLLIRELLVRGALKRCLIIAPGSLVDQWQMELDEKFHLPFDILTADRINSARGNPFDESDLLIARLDKFARDEDLQRQLESGAGVGPRRVRRGAQALRHPRRRRGQEDQAPPARRARPPVHAEPAAPHGDPAQRQARRLPAVHEPARPRPLRGAPPDRQGRRPPTSPRPPTRRTSCAG